MKKLLTFILSIIVCFSIVDSKVLNYRASDYIRNLVVNDSYTVSTDLSELKTNDYKINNYSSFVSETDNFVPKSRQDLLNIYYTILNNGWTSFSFHCDSEYKECIKDMESLAQDEETFSYINELVHPYNSYKTIETNYSNERIDVKINKKYSDEDIENINNKIKEIVSELNINSYSNINDKIKLFHDYIANTNTYDSDKENDNSTYNSDTAIGTLFEGKSVCSGYSDTFAIYLNMLGLDITRVSTSDHVWNAVKINNTWYHIDLTWDDPILTNGGNIISYDYFMLTTDKLKEKKDTEHDYNETVYNFL